MREEENNLHNEKLVIFQVCSFIEATSIQFFEIINPFLSSEST